MLRPTMGKIIRQRLLAAFLVFYIEHTLVTAKHNVCIPSDLDGNTFELCGRKGYALHCNGTNLTTVPSSFPAPTGHLKPPICVLYLNDNHIQTIENNSFINVSEVQYLYLSKNNLSYIHPNAFVDLRHLKYLNLYSNALTWPGSFGKGVFTPLVNLTHIDLKQNHIKTFKGLDEEMEPLVDLKEIFIDGCSNCSFGPIFAKFSKLENVSLSGTVTGNCVIGNVTNETVRNIPQISRLSMSNCQIANIEPSSFEPLKHLKSLNISYNEKLHFEGMNDALYGLQNHTSLEELDVTRIHSLFDVGTKLQESHVTNLKTLHNLTRLHMDENKIEVISKGILYPIYQLPKALKVVTLTTNRLTMGKYLFYLSNIHSIISLDISKQHLLYDPLVFCQVDPDSCLTISNYKQSTFKCPLHFLPIAVPPNVKTFKWRESYLYLPNIKDLCIIGGDHLSQLDLSFNLIMQWTGQVIGLPNLKHLDLSDNMCTNMTFDFFHPFPNLEYLNISANKLSRSLNPSISKHAEKSFENLSKLRTLDISRNHLSSLPSNIFERLTSLESLVLNTNELKEEDIEFNIKTIHCLKFLDLSYNKIKSLPKSLANDLDNMASGQCNTTISLIDNPIECTCRTIEFLKWMLGPVGVKVELSTYCYLEDGTRQTLNQYTANDIINHLETKCRDLTPLIVLSVSILTVIVTALVCGLMYRYRWKLRYLYYNRHRRHVREGFERLFEHDAFVSYASTMCSFVKNQLVPNLEGEHKLRMWVADRNSQPGVSMAETIVHAIANSRKSLLLIDNAFLKDSMCDYEMHMTRMESIESKRSLLIFVLFDQISLNDLPPSIFKSCTNEECLRFPNHSDSDLSEQFWMKLADAVIY